MRSALEMGSEMPKFHISEQNCANLQETFIIKFDRWVHQTDKNTLSGNFENFWLFDRLHCARFKLENLNVSGTTYRKSRLSKMPHGVFVGPSDESTYHDKRPGIPIFSLVYVICGFFSPISYADRIWKAKTTAHIKGISCWQLLMV